MLVLSITSACNLKCKTCLREHPDKISHISLELIDKILYNARKMQYDKVAITGGEPCLHPEFEEIIRLITDYGLKFGIVSNGALLEKYKFLVPKYQDKIAYLSFSLDGATRDVYEKVRQGGLYDKTVEAIKFFLNNGVYTRVGMCLNRINFHQIGDMLKFAKENELKDVTFMSAIETALNKEIVLDDEEKQECVRLIKEYNRIYKMPIRICNSLAGALGVEFCISLNLLSLELNPEGEISFCCDNIRNGAIVGSLRNESFENLFCKALDLSNQLKKIRTKILLSGKTMRGFNTCEFCNKFLKDYIK